MSKNSHQNRETHRKTFCFIGNVKDWKQCWIITIDHWVGSKEPPTVTVSSPVRSISRPRNYQTRKKNPDSFGCNRDQYVNPSVCSTMQNITTQLLQVAWRSISLWSLGAGFLDNNMTLRLQFLVVTALIVFRSKGTWTLFFPFLTVLSPKWKKSDKTAARKRWFLARNKKNTNFYCLCNSSEKSELCIRCTLLFVTMDHGPIWKSLDVCLRIWPHWSLS